MQGSAIFLSVCQSDKATKTNTGIQQEMKRKAQNDKSNNDKGNNIRHLQRNCNFSQRKLQAISLGSLLLRAFLLLLLLLLCCCGEMLLALQEFMTNDARKHKQRLLWRWCPQRMQLTQRSAQIATQNYEQTKKKHKTQERTLTSVASKL